MYVYTYTTSEVSPALITSSPPPKPVKQLSLSSKVTYKITCSTCTVYNYIHVHVGTHVYYVLYKMTS